MPEKTAVPEFQYVPGKKFVVSDEMMKAYEEDGLILVRGLMTKPELDKLELCLQNGEVVKHAFDLPDDKASVKMVIWNHPGDDYTGMIGRMERIVDTVETLLGGEVYHYHTKIVLKEALTGGSFAWHQDYGYWYKNGLLFPDLMSVSIAMDDSDMENGCLRVIRGSHKLGRIDHGRVGGQNGADTDRIVEIKKVMEEYNVVLKAGDAIFFHCNVLHTSAPNTSTRRRYAIIPCYNRVTNDAYFDHHHARVTKLNKVPDSALETCNEFRNMEGKWFMDPAIDKTIIAKKVNKDVESKIEQPSES
uniref:L-proline trans-4-hydroxylase-like isoform X1 n=2 Tax=Styela clava TaxID=7725 RepID=UPI001939DCDE|nr:L-proline trans-4-hydroxylase-like isoform X1 [Styela clava]